MRTFDRQIARFICLSAVLALAGCSRSTPLSSATTSPAGPDPSATAETRSVEADFHSLKTPALRAGEFEIITLSTLPDTVTDGDVRVAVRGLAADAALKLTAEGRDLSAAFVRKGNGDRVGVVQGLKLGDNLLVAESGGQRAALKVINHPLSGPVISGPHQQPFFCRTQDVGLGDAIDANCSIEARYQWFYRSSQNQGFKELADPYAPYPSDVIMTETTDGRAVPFVVRVESATINRGIARISVLDDPAARGPDKPFDGVNWNHRIYYVYGESCGTGYQQGTNDPSFVLGALALQEISADRLLINLVGISDRLGKGDVIVHNTLSAFGVHCNPLISIETTMLTKEYIGDRYGEVQYVIGTNGSGAALQQYNAINNAPGLLSAGMPTATFADIVSTAMTVTDCGLLQHYYAGSTLDWSQSKQAAVNGHNLLSGNQLNAICQSWTDAFLDVLHPSKGCSGRVPDEMRYNAETNPTGVRCTIQDANVNLFGKDERGFAKRPLDNVGVQYGLNALKAGTISAEEFIDLNRNIGGFDLDANYVPQRHVMDDETARRTYLFGGVIGRGALAETPVLDHAPYLDLIPTANIHEAIRPFTVRARLRERTGQTGTQSIWRGVVTQADGYPVMEQWLTSIQQPEYGGDHTAAVLAAKPLAAGDRCTFGTIGGRLELPDAILLPLGLAQLPLLPGGSVPDVDVPLRIDVPESFDQPASLGPCGIALPVTSTPRMVAGMPLSDDILKCQLKPLDAADYAGALSAAQIDELRAIFPTGVCDYTKPAAADVVKSMIWPSFGGDTLETPHELKWRAARSE